MFDGPPGLQEYERKFLLEAPRARAFWAAASRALAGHQAVPPCYVRTTYFDTPDFAYHRSSRNGVRRRLRVREYDGAEPCYLELKQSVDGVRHKMRVAVEAADVPRHLARVAGAPMVPCVATLYRRRALGDAAGRLRITLDDHLLLCKPRPIGSPMWAFAPGDVLAHGPSFVLELKFSEAPPPWLLEVLGDLREEVGFSKFTLGMSAIERLLEGARASC
jgi:hypothetical protein